MLVLLPASFVSYITDLINKNRKKVQRTRYADLDFEQMEAQAQLMDHDFIDVV